MNVFMTGGTGLIGRRLAQRLAERGDHVVILSRRSDEVRRDPMMRPFEFVPGDPTVSGAWEMALGRCDAVVNLAGHNLFAERWTPEVKRKIRDSRVYATENVVAAIAKAKDRPQTLVQGSAVGYYGPRGDEELTEESGSGTDFLAVVCREWEDAAEPAANLGTRLATIRTGIVLAPNAGALGVMTPLFKFGPGTPVGSGGRPFAFAAGQQWMSWIHLEDIVGIFLMALDNPDAQGPINGTSPHPVRNAEFARTLSRVLRRPYTPWRFFLPVGPPDFLLQMVLGEVAQIVTTGQKVLPAKAQALGASFQYPELSQALKAIFDTTYTRTEPAQPVASGAGGTDAHH